MQRPTSGPSLLVGTKKGGFIVDGCECRREWRLREPVCVGWPVQHMSYDETTGTIYAASGSPWYGPAVWRSTDHGQTWTHSSEGLAYAEGLAPVTTVWTVKPAHGRLYAGVDPAGLFVSDDGGLTWSPVPGLNEHPTRPEWQPGGAGLCLHHIVPHPTDPSQMWVAISAVGVFYTADGGETWTPRNRGVRCVFLPEESPEIGHCVHSLKMAPGNPKVLYQQNHCGVYRSADGGQSWHEITAGLPSDFGFPLAVHPHDAKTIYTLPLNPEGRYMHDGRATIWRSRDGGDNWEPLRNGLPQREAYFGVLRHGLTVDSRDPAGVYFGTGMGQLFASADGAESWQLIASYLPAISSVEVAALG